MTRVPGDLWLPEEAGQFKRHNLLTSRSMAWHGVVVARQQMAPGSYATAPILSHSLSLHVDQPVLLTRTDGNRMQRGWLGLGDLHLSVAGQSFRWHHQEVADVVNIGIDPLFLGQVAAAMELGKEQVELIPQFQTQDPVIQNAMLALMHELQTPGIGSRLYIETLTTQVAVQLIRRYSTRKVLPPTNRANLSPQQVQQVDEYIHAHLADDLALADLAALLHLSPYHFSRLFKQTTGLTPYQYLLRQRVNQAQHLLQTRQAMTLLEVAVAVGFYDESHLSRHTKRILGMAPRQVKTMR